MQSIKYDWIKLLMQEQISHLIYTSKYQLCVNYSPESKTIRIYLISKTQNQPLKFLVTECVGEDMTDPVKALRTMRELWKYRMLHVQPEKQTITFLSETQHKMEFIDNASSSQFQKDFASKRDKIANYGVKYWVNHDRKLKIDVTLDPYHYKLYMYILQTNSCVRRAEAIFSQEQLIKHKTSPLIGYYEQEELLPVFFKSITQMSTFQIKWGQKILCPNHKLLKPIPLYNVVSTTKKQSEQAEEEKVLLFRHIFLTQLMAHMITSKFGRWKDRNITERYGNQREEYQDEELEELRNFGHRFSQFRDHPIKRQKSKLFSGKKYKKARDNEDDYQDDDEEQEQKQKQTNQGKQKKNQNQKQQNKPKTKLQMMAEKVKKMEGICSFTFISNEEKSRINRRRFSLHQITRQTDYTQAFIHFIQLVFQSCQRKDLIGNGRQRKIEKQKMQYFMNQFKVKRNIQNCLTEYSRQSFFHRVLNIGLRVFREPYEIVYLRLPFSHLFYSIKLIYRRHKRAMLEQSKGRNKKRKILLFRGFQIDQNEAKTLSENIGGFLEVEGFLSTSLKESLSEVFKINAKMIIEVGVSNLGSSFDNGFAHISEYSEHPGEQEILVNAFNVFKVLSFYSNFDKDAECIIHTITLEYGSLKTVEDKVKKSEQLLDAEYMYQVNLKQLTQAKVKLDVNKEKLSSQIYDQLAELLPKASQQLKRRNQQLKEWAEEQYKEALQNLTQWEKELIVNTKHQQQQLWKFQNYGRLLFEVGEYRRAIVYYSRRMKQIQLDRAVQGVHWRKSCCLIFKQAINRTVLNQCYLNLGRFQEGLSNSKKLLDIFNYIGMKESEEKYYSLLNLMHLFCSQIIDKSKQGERYKKKVENIIQKYQLFDTDVYKQMKKGQKEKEENEKEDDDSETERQRENEKEKKVKQMNEKLENIRLLTYGQFSTEYLELQSELVDELKNMNENILALEQGLKYLSIRKARPQVQKRITTSKVFINVLSLCIEMKSKQYFYMICTELASFIRSTIYSNQQFTFVYIVVRKCLDTQWWRAGRKVIKKLIRAKVKCTLEKQTVSQFLNCSYLLLLLSVSQQSLVEMFLNWADGICQQQQLPPRLSSFIKHIIDYNETYSKSGKGVGDERNKDYKDAQIIHSIQQQIKGKFSLKDLRMSERTGELIPWHHPFHPLERNQAHLKEGIEMYSARSLTMMIQYHLQYKNLNYNQLKESTTNDYLRRMSTLSKLHLSPYHLTQIPSWLEFCPFVMFQLQAVQIEQMGIDLVKGIISIISYIHHSKWLPYSLYPS